MAHVRRRSRRLKNLQLPYRNTRPLVLRPIKADDHQAPVPALSQRVSLRSDLHPGGVPAHAGRTPTRRRGSPARNRSPPHLRRRPPTYCECKRERQAAAKGGRCCARGSYLASAPTRPRLHGNLSQMDTQYVNMMLALDDIPALHNLAASFFAWILLAGFILFPGTFTSLQNIGPQTGTLGQELIGQGDTAAAVRILPLHFGVWPAG